MPDYTLKLKEDLVDQFKDKPVIEALMEVVGEQLNDLYNFFVTLKEQRGVQTSFGKQLDGVGDIVVLSRKEAGELACIKKPSHVIDDEEYRKYLIYKIWRNSCKCTYPDIIKAFRMFWDKPLYYSESPDYPATMLFETSELAPEDNAHKILTVPFVKSAGVAIKIIAYTVNPQMTAELRIGSALGRGYQGTTLPEIPIGIALEDTLRTIPFKQNIMQTILPEMEV